MATKLIKLQEVVSEEPAAKKNRSLYSAHDNLLTLAQENKQLKKEAKDKDEELRNIHVKLSSSNIAIRLRKHIRLDQTLQAQYLLELKREFKAMYKICLFQHKLD